MIHIREARPDDAAQIVRLICEAEGGADSPLTEAYALHYCANRASHILLAEEVGAAIDGAAIGLLSYSTRPDLYHAGECCLVEELIVRADRRNEGVGGALLEAVLQRAAQAGWAEVSVGVMPDNDGAQRFYRRHGLADEALLLERHFTVV